MNWGGLAVGIALVVAGVGDSGAAGASSLTIDISQAGLNVVVTGSGAINLTGLTYDVTGPQLPQLGPDIAYVAVGTPAQLDLYLGISGPVSFGSGGLANADSSSGDIFGIAGYYSELGVPAGYTSGTPLYGTETFDGATFASLGLTPGAYTYTSGRHEHLDR